MSLEHVAGVGSGSLAWHQLCQDEGRVRELYTSATVRAETSAKRQDASHLALRCTRLRTVTWTKTHLEIQSYPSFSDLPSVVPAILSCLYPLDAFKP